MCGVEPHATPEWPPPHPPLPKKHHTLGAFFLFVVGGGGGGGGGVSAGLPSDGHKEDWVRERVQRIDALQCGG